jgi:beta-lactamase regulating signal transducer with metallopeptidase domain
MTAHFDGFAHLAWTQLWQVTAVAAVLGLVVRFCCRERPRLAYALGMLVVVKALVPPLWSSPTGVFSWALAGAAVARPEGVAGSPAALSNSATEAGVDEGPTHPDRAMEGTAAHLRETVWTRVRLALLAAWAAGLVVGAGVVFARGIACALLIRRSRVPVDERDLRAVEELARRLGLRRRVRLAVTARPVGPAAFGLLRPAILLPEPLLAGTPAEQVELILAHELIHIRRGDLLAGRLQLVAQLVWWFHPLVWWTNRAAGRAREHCCDEEVVSGVGCKPVLYARTLLSVLEQKGRLRSLAAFPGVRALEVTSQRLEAIMRSAETHNPRRPRRLARLAFAAGAALLVPGMGLTAAQPAGGQKADAPKKQPAVILKGVVREKGTGRPVAGVRVAVLDTNTRAVTDGAGRYELAVASKADSYKLIISPRPGDPYLITSRVVEAGKEPGQGPLSADVEVVRGIPFHVRVLDQKTGKPLKGYLSYFPLSPNNPFERGVMGYAAGKEFVLGAFYEANPDEEGVFRGAVLPGPGFLGFKFPFKPGDPSKPGDKFQDDRKPVISYPDGRQNLHLISGGSGSPIGLVPLCSEPLNWIGTPLGQFNAVIAIDPREGAEQVTYEIRIAADPRP